MSCSLPQCGSFIRGTQGIREECVLDVSQHQFLVLLFVIQAQNDAPRRFLINCASQESLHLLINVRAESQNLIE